MFRAWKWSKTKKMRITGVISPRPTTLSQEAGVYPRKLVLIKGEIDPRKFKITAPYPDTQCISIFFFTFILVNFCGKCRNRYHTLSVWDIECLWGSQFGESIFTTSRPTLPFNPKGLM